MEALLRWYLKTLPLLSFLACSAAFGQTYPSPTFNNVTLKASLSGGSVASPVVGDVSAATAQVPSGGSARALSAFLSDVPTVAAFKASSDADDSAAASRAITAAKGGLVNFGYRSTGYYLNSAASNLANNTVGTFYLNGNTFTGGAIGSPGTGSGAFASLYTNPWLITTHLKREMDPAAATLPSAGSASIGEAIECLPNRRNSADAAQNSRMVACEYIGTDTGSGGASGTAFTMEDLNLVLNLSTNSGSSQEIDLNFNGKVSDGGVSRGLFITGGGAAGNNTNAVALDIMHGAYDGSYLPWTTGISIRQTINQIRQYRASASEAGTFNQTFDETGAELTRLDKKGYFTTQAGYTAGGASGAPSFTARAVGADDYTATVTSATDTGFAFRLFSYTGATQFSIDKNGYVIMAGLRITGGYTPSSSATCNTGTMFADDNYIYVCTSAKVYKKSALASL